MEKLRKGYDEDFLGKNCKVKLPTAGLEIMDDVLVKDTFRDDIYIDYIHYSIMMSKSSKTAFFSAANLDQDTLKVVSGRRWFVDSRIGGEFQIDNKSYKNNPWDKGHLTRRTAITWGSSHEATHASNDSCSYANASLQHENFNRDEWRVPEEIVHYFEKDKNNKISIFTGPIFTETDRWLTNKGNLADAVRIPSGFWKIIAYIDKITDEIACQAYVMYQDAEFLADRRGRKDLNVKNYQVTVTEIEELTGLEFDKVLFEKNPLNYFPHEGINDEPEAFIAPSNLSYEELDKGIVFTRKEAESEEFKERKIVLSTK